VKVTLKSTVLNHFNEGFLWRQVSNQAPLFVFRYASIACCLFVITVRLPPVHVQFVVQTMIAR